MNETFLRTRHLKRHVTVIMGDGGISIILICAINPTLPGARDATNSWRPLLATLFVRVGKKKQKEREKCFLHLSKRFGCRFFEFEN